VDSSSHHWINRPWLSGEAEVPVIPKWIGKTHFHEVLILKILILGKGQLGRCIGCEISFTSFTECFNGFYNAILPSLDCSVDLFL
jgi:hypothetical protein